MGVGNIQAPESIVVGATATPAPTGMLDRRSLSAADDTTGETPAPAAAFTRPGRAAVPPAPPIPVPRPPILRSNESGDTSGTDDTATDTDTTYVWASNSDSYYHKTNTCTNITGTPTKVSLDIARSPRADVACPVCYGTQAGGTKYYMPTRPARYYHIKDQTCSGMKNAAGGHQGGRRPRPGKKPCPVCIGVRTSPPRPASTTIRTPTARA